MIVQDSLDNKILLGWREWVSMPELGIPAIKAKVDTGARTSSLHAFQVETFEECGRRKVRFGIHPLQKREDVTLWCETEVIDHRRVSDSGGHREMRYVIHTPVRLGSLLWNVEVTLTDRETMQFRMLLGRTAMVGRFTVDPESSYLMGRKLRHAYRTGKKRKGA